MRAQAFPIPLQCVPDASAALISNDALHVIVFGILVIGTGDIAVGIQLMRQLAHVVERSRGWRQGRCNDFVATTISVIAACGCDDHSHNDANYGNKNCKAYVELLPAGSIIVFGFVVDYCGLRHHEIVSHPFFCFPFGFLSDAFPLELFIRLSRHEFGRDGLLDLRTSAQRFSLRTGYHGGRQVARIGHRRRHRIRIIMCVGGAAAVAIGIRTVRVVGLSQRFRIEGIMTRIIIVDDSGHRRRHHPRFSNANGYIVTHDCAHVGHGDIADDGRCHASSMSASLNRAVAVIRLVVVVMDSRSIINLSIGILKIRELLLFAADTTGHGGASVGIVRRTARVRTTRNSHAGLFGGRCSGSSHAGGC
mmetsp:Transcript_3164/g.8948  ORF Transcript_3164/g.8948 Transcript_3164/m.8948 type:complete len:363 (-) Transcript_3164:2854-3942(-)